MAIVLKSAAMASSHENVASSFHARALPATTGQTAAGNVLGRAARTRAAVLDIGRNMTRPGRPCYGVFTSGNAFEQPGSQFTDFHAVLFIAVAFANGYGVLQLWTFFAKRFKVYSHAEWSTRFVLTRVAAANAGGLI